MACSGCGGGNRKFAAPTFHNKIKAPIINNPVKNIASAAISQSNVFRWFRDGITGLVKCFTGSSLYSDEDIIKNRDVCRECEHSTKTDDRLTLQSQCMAPDPQQNNAPCGCFITCKTQTGKCPLNKWTTLTISTDKQEKLVRINDINIDI